MRLSDDARYPHPVLGPLTNDYTAGEFSISFTVREDLETGAFALAHQIVLSEPSMLQLVESGRASVGCLVVCRDTYYNRLHTLSFPKGFMEFPRGSLLNRVSLRPVIWLNREQAKLDSANIHPEFGSAMVGRGDIIGLDEEYSFPVGKAKQATMESIFELVQAPELKEGNIEVALDRERIAIMLAPNTYQAINLLRGQAAYQPVMLSGVYLPAVMEVLDQIRGAPETYSSHRWYRPFMAKCELKGLTLNENIQLAQAAQALLDYPVGTLENLLKGDQ